MLDPNARNARPVGRAPRSGGSLPGTPQTTQRSQVIRRETPQIESARSGLESLPYVFNSFFNKFASAADAMASAEHAKDIARIEEENTVEATKGYTDANTGAPIDPALADDRDYTSAYTTSLARTEAARLAAEYPEYLQGLGLGQDAEGAREAFLRDRLKNGSGLGTGDPLFDAELLATFKSKTDSINSAYNEAGVKARVAEGVRMFQAEVGANFDDYEATDLPGLFAQARALNPLDPEAAKANVVSALFSAAGNDSASIHKVVNMLRSPASGDGERSFADMNPERMLEIEDTAYRRFYSGASIASDDALHPFASDIETSNDVAYLLNLASPDGPVEDIMEKLGGRQKGRSLQAKALKKATALLDAQVEFNNALTLTDASLTKKHWYELLQHYTGNSSVHEDPSAAALFTVEARGVVSDDVRNELSASLTDFTNPDRMQSALNYYSALENMTSREYAEARMSADVKTTYRYLSRQALTRQPMNVVAEQLKLRASQLDQAQNTSFARFYPKGTTERDAESQMNESIRDMIKDRFGASAINDATMAMLRNRAREEHFFLYGAEDVGKIDQIIQDVVETSGGLTAVPRPDGTIALRASPFPSVVPALGPTGDPLLDENGRTLGRAPVVLGRAVPHPDMPGEVLDTLSIWDNDKRDFAAAAAGLGLDPDNMGLGESSLWNADGAYVVYHGSNAVSISLGEKVTIGDKTFILPEDIVAAENMIAELNPQFGRAAPVAGSGDVLLRAAQTSARPEGVVPIPADERFFFAPHGDTGFILLYVPGPTERFRTVTEIMQQEQGT